MDAKVKDVVRECTAGSDEGHMRFPRVVALLLEAGVEHYHADFRRSEKTYYMPNGESEVVASDPVTAVRARDFSPEGVADAVRAIQTRQIMYREFCQRIAAAGCVGYFVFLSGRRASYFGRDGDTYIDPFPSAAN